VGEGAERTRSVSKAGEGAFHCSAVAARPLTRLNLAMLDFATLSRKGRGKKERLRKS